MTRSDLLSFNGQKLVQVFKANATLRRRIADFIAAHDEQTVCHLLEMPRKGFAKIALTKVVNGHPWPRVALNHLHRKLDEFDASKGGNRAAA